MSSNCCNRFPTNYHVSKTLSRVDSNSLQSFSGAMPRSYSGDLRWRVPWLKLCHHHSIRHIATTLHIAELCETIHETVCASRWSKRPSPTVGTTEAAGLIRRHAPSAKSDQTAWDLSRGSSTQSIQRHWKVVF